MPLLLAQPGEKNTIMAVRGRGETKRFLESMGFVEGAEISVVSEFDGNLIVNVKEVGVAWSKVMAGKSFI